MHSNRITGRRSTITVQTPENRFGRPWIRWRTPVHPVRYKNAGYTTSALSDLTVKKFSTFLQPINYASIFWALGFSPPVTSSVVIPPNGYVPWDEKSGTTEATLNLLNFGVLDKTKIVCKGPGLYTITYAIYVVPTTPTITAFEVAVGIDVDGQSFSFTFSPEQNSNCNSGSCIVPLKMGSVVQLCNLSGKSLGVRSVSISITPL